MNWHVNKEEINLKLVLWLERFLISFWKSLMVTKGICIWLKKSF